MKLAFLGLGVMGYPMAGHLSRAGHQVTVFNRTAPKSAKWTEAFGGSSAATPAAAAKGAEIVLMCVGNDDDVRAVITGADGALAGMTAGTILVDHTTASAHVAREMHAAAAAKGVAIPRCAGLRRPGGRRERQAHDHGRRRPGDVRQGGTRARDLRPRGDADGRFGKRPTHQDGQSDMHRRTGAGAVGGNQFRVAGGPRPDEGARRDQQGRRAVLANGEPRRDDDRGQIRLRLRRRLDAQGPRHMPGGGARQWRPAAGNGARRPVLRAGAGARRAGAGTRRR